MDHDSESSLDGGRKNKEDYEEQPVKQQGSSQTSSYWLQANASATSNGIAPSKLGAAAASRSLSAQVMEYCQKYSKSSNLPHYFALPISTRASIETVKGYYTILDSKTNNVSSKKCIGEDNIRSGLPKERRRWNTADSRPPLIGQSSVEGSSIFIQPMSELLSPLQQKQLEPHQEQSKQESEVASAQEKNVETAGNSLVVTEPSPERKVASSPTSSIASYKPLEWDSGADVGYTYEGGTAQLGTIERMALVRGCSAALRLDPEGTTEQQHSPGPKPAQLTSVVVAASPGEGGLLKSKPDANSTPLQLASVSGSDSEIEITPIVKNHLPGIVSGNQINSENLALAASKSIRTANLDAKDVVDTPKSSAPVFKLPYALNYVEASESRISESAVVKIVGTVASELSNDEDLTEKTSLKKSSSMNLLAQLSSSELPLKRSQSELNLAGVDKYSVPKLIFNSTSSIATVVNRPKTCNKLIQTSMRLCAQESIGVQVSVLKDEEKPPLPKRATSLVPRSLNSILKSSKNTYKVENSKAMNSRDRSSVKEDEQNEKEDEESSSDSSQNDSLTPQADDIENATGRANSFEYFPGHIYENVPNGSSNSRVSSIDTGRSNSTMPNTSSSIEEKLWGDSDSLVRDLERSVNILKSLVDANKLDKQVKKRLIHHVVKRLVTAKYTDDKIEHNLEENVPWNPADARNKVYRAEIIQALAKNTTDSSDDWKPSQKNKSLKKQVVGSEARGMKKIGNTPAEIESSNSDKFDRNTDRTLMDGRKARMGLRADDCDRRCSSNTPTNKSESSECFLPQRGFTKNSKIKDMFITSTSNSSPQDQNRALLDAVVDSRRSPVDSSHEAGHSVDWRLPTTMSERRYESRRCSNSDSGDTKLVSYVEMEKRNQLIWITNEISHLSNLKKLLEQPKVKPERPSKLSPRKSKPSSKPLKSLASSHRQRNGNIIDEENELSRQWSSHCNLANCSTPSGIVRRLKKRNSCTQTATDSSAAYSRTGSEIVSARIHSPNMKWSNVCVQTPKPPAPPAPVLPSQVYSGCPVHQPTVPPVICNCSERYCLVCAAKNVSQQQNQTYMDGRDNPHRETNFLCNDSGNMKQTKNQLNATKSKCSYNNTNDKVNDKRHIGRSNKIAMTCRTCDQHHCDKSACSGARYKFPEPSCQNSKECNCENRKLICDLEKMQINKSPRKKLFDKTSGGLGCTCDCKKPEESHSPESEYSYHINEQAQPYYLLNKNEEAKSKECCCGKKSNGQEQSYASPLNSARTNSSTSSDSKYCGICGTIYQKDRKCGCVPKTYPKGIAYELEFVNDNKLAADSDLEVKSIKTASRERLKDVSICVCGNTQRTIKHLNCNRREEQPRKFKINKSTLQDYLATNNPRFSDNVETRRQYVSEIQRLRQLRKDRRMQLLAMATTTTNIFTSPRPTKVTKCIQKKLTDEELKVRLRKRYSQLTEVRAKRKQQRLKEEAKCNKLMAKIFCKKLQQKVLKGEVDLSQSGLSSLGDVPTD